MISYGAMAGNPLFCLGQTPHPMVEGEQICRICGTLVTGAQLGIYKIQRYLGQGRSGKAYMATHQRSRQPIVIKLFPPDRASMSLWEHARRELRDIMALQHPAILPVYSCTTWSPMADNGNSRPLGEQMLSYTGREHYLLTLCQHTSLNLHQFIAHYEQQGAHTSGLDHDTPMLARLLQLIKQVGSALSTLHNKNLAHGALTPGNLLLPSLDRILLADCALGRLHPPAQPYLPPEMAHLSTLCYQTGNMSSYWQAANPISDQYMFSVLCQQLFSRLLNPADYEHLLPILQTACHTQPGKRYASVDKFVHELLAQGHASRPFPASSYGQRNTSGIHLNNVNQIPQTPLPEQSRLSSQSGITGGQSRHNSQAGITGGQSRYNSQAGITGGGNTGSQQLPSGPDWFEQMTSYHLATSAANPVDDWEKLGDKHFTNRRYEDALKAYSRALELAPGRFSLWLALGDTQFARGQHREALRAYEQAIQLNPDSADAWTNCGTALDALGRRKEALHCFTQAEQLSV